MVSLAAEALPSAWRAAEDAAGVLPAGTVLARVGSEALAATALELRADGVLEDGELAAACGHFVHVYVDRRTRRPVPLPTALKTVLETIL